DHVVPGAAGERRNERAQRGGPAAEARRHGAGSDEVWSWRMYQREPRLSRSSVNGPLAVTAPRRSSLKRAVHSASDGVRGRTRTSSKASESRALPGAK